MSYVARFRALHEDDLFVMPNAWDAGSARVLEHLGFPALATTSSGLAASLGRADQRVKRDELIAHVDSLTAAVSVPVNVDAEGCYPSDSGGIAKTVDLLAKAGASGFSIEDYEPGAGLLPVDDAATRVHEAAAAASPHGLVVTARAENHLYGVGDVTDTVARLATYRDAGADVVYAPGLASINDIAQVIDVGPPVNVLAIPGIPLVSELAAAGVRRVSTGGSLAWAAYGALAAAATELRDSGTTSYLDAGLSRELRESAFSV